MAEFKLGRIRFVWKGEWAAATVYVKDDVVKYGGKTYICQAGHTSNSNFYNDLESVPTFWNQMTDGQEWKGDWTTETFYAENDVVKYGGLLYICIDSHTSAETVNEGLEFNQSDWQLFAEGFDWKGDWSASTRYKKNDLVRYGGYTYVCNLHHESAATVELGLEADQLKWDEFNRGLEYKGEWSNSSVRYKINDVVKYGGGLWICVTPHTSSGTFASQENNWNIFVKGLEFENEWNNSTTYQPGDIVKYGGNQYVAKTNHVGQVPTSGTTHWNLFTEGFNFLNDWIETTSYKIGDVVKVSGYSYIATSDSPSLQLTVTATSSVLNVLQVASTVGITAGQSIVFKETTFGNVAADQIYYIRSVVNSTQFTITDTPGGNLITLSAGTGSMTAYVTRHPTDSAVWQVLTSGINWKGTWQDDVTYELGDTIIFGNNSYICIRRHRSEQDDGSTIRPEGGGSSNSRPDQDITGIYWNVIAIGSETSVLTTKGDLVYYSESGPTRLPVGIEGQVLRVSDDNLPEWVTLAVQDYTFYVATNGVDKPAPMHGLSFDKPWASIRYACEQIEKGARNPNAQRLLELNRVFIQKEVTSWIDYQIENATVGSIWENFDYDEYKCERDVGFLVDRLIWDIGHGGNLKIRAAAQTYLNVLADGPFSNEDDENGTGTYTRLTEERLQDVASFNYMLSVIESVLNNEPPETVYQNVTDDSTTVVDQYIDQSLITEPEVISTVQGLVGIITTAIETQDPSTIPERNVPNYLINVATGRYRETLPIIVPAYTCVKGAELRSTNAGPAGSLVDISDSFYTINTFDRIADVVAEIVTGSSVTKTIGNTSIQDIAAPFGDTIESDAVSRLVRVMKFQADWRLNTMHASYLTDPVGGTNNALDAGFFNARKLIKDNKEFFQAEVIAFLEETYPNLKYQKTLTKRDVGYIIDALVYDLTYGGNALSVKAGLAYFDGDDDSQPQISASIKAATLASQAFLKTLLQTVAVDSVVTAKQTAVDQVRGDAGSSTAANFVANNIDDIISIVNIGPDAVGSTVTLINPSTTWVSTSLTTAYSILQSALATIKTNVRNFLTTNYPGLLSTTNLDKSERDAEIVITAVGYDFMFDSNYQTIKAAHAYLRPTAKELFLQSTQIKEATLAALEFTRQQAIANVGGNQTAIDRINASMQTVYDIVFGGSNDGSICQTEQRNRDYAALQLERNRDFIVREVSAWINYNYVDFSSYYNSDTCERDIGLIIDAVSYDLATGSNVASSIAGSAYYRIQSALVPSSQMLQTLASIRYAKELALNEIEDSSRSAVATAFENVYNILKNGLGAVPTYTFPSNGSSTVESEADAAALQSNKSTYQSGVASYLNTNYNELWVSLGAEGQAACTRDVGYIVDAISYDIQYGGNYQSVIAGEAYYSFGTLQIAPGEKTATIAAYNELATLMKVDTSNNGDTRVDALIANIVSIINTGTSPAVTYPVVTNESADVQASFAALQSAKTTIATDVTEFIVDKFSSYTYNQALCLRDVGTYIDALKFDLKYPGNYKSRYVARYYANAVTGSQEEDMFYLRDGTGVRDMTLADLNGDLTPPNEYGTSRTTAGAYCSLDPGWGPADFTAWILSRSPYIQGVTTFGHGAIGQKIDGALHNGGNDSMVSNDFTQVISDGIGAWVANNGRAELVSVFTYYSHIGYLSTEGGRIRGTNGNNSYGDFGSVAEGFDERETPNTAIVDNRGQFVATVRNVNSNGSALLNYEFENAGIDYTEATWTVTGGGLNASVVQDEFRDDAVFQVRLLDFGNDSSGQFGGEGYKTNSNTAQGGTTTSITIAATDDELSTAYVGMKIVLTGGTGAGQFGIITTYNAGTKLATVVRERDGAAGWDHFVPGTTIVSPDASTTYTIEPRLIFTAPEFNSEKSVLSSSGTWNSVVYGETAETYTNVTGTYSGTAGTGATFDVIRNGWKYIVSINNAGLDYTRLETITIPGTSLGGLSPTNDLTITITAVSSITGEILEFDQEGYGIGGRFVAVKNSSDKGSYSNNGTTWVEMTLPTSGNWSAVAHGLIVDGSTLTKVSRFVAVRSGSTAAAWSADGINWTATTMPESAAWSGIAFGNGQFVAVASDSTTVAISLDGEVWDITAVNNNASTDIIYGRNRFVTTSAGSTNIANTSADGETWTQRTLPATSNWNSVAWGNNRFVAVANNSNSGAYSLNGIDWTATTIGSVDESSVAGFTKVRYGQGIFAVTSYNAGVEDYAFVSTSENGLNWTVRGLDAESNSVSGFNAIAFGNPQRTSTWVAVGDTTNAVKFKAGATAKARAFVAEERIFAITILEPGSGYNVEPTMTIVDPNNLFELPFDVRTGKGVLANPSFINRGSQYNTGSAEIFSGDGVADNYQSGGFVAVRRLTQRPVPGSNVNFDNLPNRTFKIVNVFTFLGSNDGAYTAFFQVSPTLTISEAPEHLSEVSTRIRYSQVRLTGHDFLDIGTGNFDKTNYPNTPSIAPDPSKETVTNNGGRVFYTSTDQDGNFRVGDLFAIEQSTGIATLNADAFNISGLQELNLGNVTLGGGSATVTEFSTDPFFTADSDNVVPTQRAIKAYISAQIGGGGASLNVNSVTAGSIFISSNVITTTGGIPININATFNFKGGVTGAPLAFNYFFK